MKKKSLLLEVVKKNLFIRGRRKTKSNFNK